MFPWVCVFGGCRQKSLSLGLSLCLALSPYPGEEEMSSGPTLTHTIQGSRHVGSPLASISPHPAGDRLRLRKTSPIELVVPSFLQLPGALRPIWAVGGGLGGCPRSRKPFREQCGDFTASLSIPSEIISFILPLQLPTTPNPISADGESGPERKRDPVRALGGSPELSVTDLCLFYQCPKSECISSLFIKSPQGNASKWVPPKLRSPSLPPCLSVSLGTSPQPTNQMPSL